VKSFKKYKLQAVVADHAKVGRVGTGVTPVSHRTWIRTLCSKRVIKLLINRTCRQDRCGRERDKRAKRGKRGAKERQEIGFKRQREIKRTDALVKRRRRKKALAEARACVVCTAAWSIDRRAAIAGVTLSSTGITGARIRTDRRNCREK
jgi:hypothetical protein